MQSTKQIVPTINSETEYKNTLHLKTKLNSPSLNQKDITMKSIEKRITFKTKTKANKVQDKGKRKQYQQELKNTLKSIHKKTKMEVIQILDL